MKTIIAGSRHIDSYGAVWAAMRTCPFEIEITSVISGHARGVDVSGEHWASEHGHPIKIFSALWRDKDGVKDMRAGFKRNQEMADYADALIAVWDGKSNGTADMIIRMIKARKRVHIHYVC